MRDRVAKERPVGDGNFLPANPRRDFGSQGERLQGASSCLEGDRAQGSLKDPDGVRLRYGRARVRGSGSALHLRRQLRPLETRLRGDGERMERPVALRLEVARDRLRGIAFELGQPTAPVSDLFAGTLPRIVRRARSSVRFRRTWMPPRGRRPARKRAARASAERRSAPGGEEIDDGAGLEPATGEPAQAKMGEKRRAGPLAMRVERRRLARTARSPAHRRPRARDCGPAGSAHRRAARQSGWCGESSSKWPAARA